MSRFSKILGALSIAALPLLAATPALAQPAEPVHSHLTDTVDAITSPDTLTKKIENFANKTPYELYIVIVDDFDGETPEQWTDKTVDLSSLDTNSILFALATESREYGWTSTTTSIDANDINDAIDDDVYSDWSHNDYEEGLTLFVTNLTDELSGTSSSSHSSQSSSNTESNVIGSLVGIGVVGAGTAGAVVISRRRRAKHAQEATEINEAQLNTQASSALIQADDGVRAAANELEFARAEFGEEATREFEKSLESARQKIAQAWELRTLLDDDVPEPAAQAKQMNTQILELVRSAQADISQQEERFTQLRNLSANVDTYLDKLTVYTREIAEQIDTAETQFNALALTYPESSLSTLRTYPAQIETLLEAAREAITQGKDAAVTDKRKATIFARTAEDEIQQARFLASKITNARASFEEANELVKSGVTSLQSDIADADRLATDNATITTLKEKAEDVVARALQPKIDPFLISAELADTEQALDTALESLRTQEANTQRNKELSERAGKMARDAIDEADHFIDRYSTWVTERPRNYLAAAKKTFNTALQSNDYARTAALFNEARTSAVNALNTAQHDINTASRASSNSSFSSGSDIGSVLGGMILGSILSGGGFSGGYSSGSFGNSGFSGGRISGSGSFGGSSRSGSF